MWVFFLTKQLSVTSNGNSDSRCKSYDDIIHEENVKSKLSNEIPQNFMLGFLTSAWEAMLSLDSVCVFVASAQKGL